jgi:hypothetical protein
MNVPKFSNGCHLQFNALDELFTTGIKADSSAYTNTDYLHNDVISVLDKHGLPMLNFLRLSRLNQANRLMQATWLSEPFTDPATRSTCCYEYYGVTSGLVETEHNYGSSTHHNVSRTLTLTPPVKLHK